MSDDGQRTPVREDRKKDDGAGRSARRHGVDLVSWMVVAAMVVVAGGAGGYLYLHGHAATPTIAHAPTTTKEHTGKKSPAKTAATAYYPPLGTPTRPVTGDVVEPFGWQYEKTIGLYRDVPGWALAATKGEDVRAVVGGRVVANFVDPTEGREIVVNSKNGDSVIYGDVSAPGPAIGAEVRAGQTFAQVGDPGRLSGVSAPHLFLEVTVGGQPVSPATLLGAVPGSDMGGTSAPAPTTGATTPSTKG